MEADKQKVVEQKLRKPARPRKETVTIRLIERYSMMNRSVQRRLATLLGALLLTGELPQDTWAGAANTRRGNGSANTANNRSHGRPLVFEVRGAQ